MKHRKGPKTRGQAASKPAAPLANLPMNGFDPSAVEHKSDEMQKPASAFDVWLERGLHTLFDEVANEPIPPELLQLIEDDRRKVDDNKTE